MIDLVRDTALSILNEINENGAYSNIAFNRHVEKHDFSNAEKAFITDLVYGTVKWKLTIDWIIGQYSNIKLKKISPWIMNILRLGVYQILFLEKVPDSAACNESVKLSKRYGHQGSSRFVNGLLRNVIRDKNNIKYPEDNLVEYLSLRYSHPEWMVKRWVDHFGPQFTEELLESNNSVPEFCIRVNTLKTTREELKKLLEQEDIQAEDGQFADEALIIKNPASITKLDLYKKGYFQIQDESSMLVSKVLGPKPGQLVVDVCSAPGGKSMHIAQLMQNKGKVISRDIHEHKIKLINEGAKRLGVDIIEASVFDARMTDVNLIAKADCVLVDAPCSGFGIIRRKPDIKWSRKPDDKNEIAKLQYDILNNAAHYVKPGGKLVYSTCTIEKDENNDIVERFLKNNKDFYLGNIKEDIPSKISDSVEEEGFIQLYPNVHGTDGFFISKMIKRG
mgnify:CR=1 FL=1